MLLQEKPPQKDLLRGNIMNLMNWENTTVPFAAIICSDQIQSFRLPVAGQVFLKPINRVLLTTGILLTEWKELRSFASVAILI